MSDNCPLLVRMRNGAHLGRALKFRLSRGRGHSQEALNHRRLRGSCVAAPSLLAGRRLKASSSILARSFSRAEYMKVGTPPRTFQELIFALQP